MRYFTTLLLAALAFGATAQNDTKAKEILDRAAAKFKAYPAAEITFTLSMENNAEDIHETHPGKAWMKGNLYRLDLMDTENYYDGNAIYTYMPDVKEVNIKNPGEEEEGFLNPTTLFDIHNQGFDQKLLSSAGSATAHIELYPTEDRNFEKIGIWVNPGTNEILKVISFGKDGNQVIIEIRSVKSLNPVPSDSFFKFNPSEHADVEVVDMR